MKKIIIDTNALLAISELKIDIFTELEKTCDFPYNLQVIEGTMTELEKIKQEQRGKYKHAARVAELLIVSKKIKIIPSEGDVDDILVEKSQNGALILTQDRELKRRLQKPYLTIRQQKKIVLIM